jgi:transcriptional regulator with XRE-family HTH domain
MPDLVELGSVIRTARRGQRLTQSDLARKSGVSRARIDALENSRAAGIGFKPVLRLLNALGLDLKVGELDRGRPTLEDLMAEEGGDAAHLDR